MMNEQTTFGTEATADQPQLHRDAETTQQPAQNVGVIEQVLYIHSHR